MGNHSSARASLALRHDPTPSNQPEESHLQQLAESLGRLTSLARKTEIDPLAAPTILSKISQSNGKQLHPRTMPEAIERALIVHTLFKTGVLEEEVERLGVSPSWIRQYHEQPPAIGIAEQLMPLPTLFAKLGKFGRPDALVDALARVEKLGDLYHRYTGTAARLGFLYSEMQMFRRDSITSGPYLIYPNLSSGDQTKTERLTKFRLFTKKQIERMDSLPFRSLEIGHEQMLKIHQALTNEVTNARKSAQKATKATVNLARYIDQRAEDGHPITRDIWKRQQHGTREAARNELSFRAISILENIWDDTLSTLPLSTGKDNKKVAKYADFVSAFNSSFVQRFTGTSSSAPDAHQTISSHIADELPTSGVKDWGTFLSAMFQSEILKPTEPLFRYVDSTGKMRMLTLDNLSSQTVKEISTGQVHAIKDLVAESQENLQRHGFPTLVPVAGMRYWAMYVVGNGVVLEDGMPYDKIERVAAAARSSQICLEPRGLLIYPYTDLNLFSPNDRSDPYAQLKEEFSIIDYLRLAEHS